jgi:hypothetical protein
LKILITGASETDNQNLRALRLLDKELAATVTTNNCL